MNPPSDNPFEEVLNSEHPWSIKNIGCNAISGIVNDSSAQDRFFLSAPKGLRGIETLPTIPPTPVRRIRPSEFDPYLHTLEDVIDRHQLNRALGLAATQGIPQLGSSSNSLDLTLAGDPALQELTARVVGTTTTASAAGISKVQRTRMLSVNVLALSTVPSIFLDKDFDLSNPHTFSAACDYMDIVGSNTTDSSSINRLLQDTITHHLDTVEVHLLNEISRRSSSFFSALSNLQNLHNETEECVCKIQDLRTKLASVSLMTAQNGLEVVRLKHRRGNVGFLYGAVKLIADIKHTQSMIQVLLGQADYVGVLDLIKNTSFILMGLDSSDADDRYDSSPQSVQSQTAASDTIGVSRQCETQELIDGISLTRNRSIIPRNLDLRGVRSLMNFSGQLTELAKTVSVIMENEFTSALQMDLKEKVTEMIAESMTLVLSPTATVAIPLGKSTALQQTLAGTTKTKPQPLASIVTSLTYSPATASAPITTAISTSNMPISIRIQNIVSGTHRYSIAQTPSVEITPPGSEIRANEEKLVSKLTPLVLGLLRTDRLGSALRAHRDDLIKQVKTMVKQYYPVISEIGSTSPDPKETPADASLQSKKEGQSALSLQLRSMTFDKFYAMLIRVYIASLHIIQRTSTIHQVLLSIITDAQKRGIDIGSNSVQSMAVALTLKVSPETATQPSTARRFLDDDDELGSLAELPEMSQDFMRRSSKKGGMADASSSASDLVGDASATTYGQMCNESLDVLTVTSDLIQARCAKLIGVRSEQNAKLNATDFYRLFGSTWEFVTSSELLCGRMCFGLKSVILTHAKAFLLHFHDEKSKQIAVLIENEQWAQADVPVDFQHITEQLQLAPLSAMTDRMDKNRLGSLSDELDVNDDISSRKSDPDDGSGDEMDLASSILIKANIKEMKKQQKKELIESAPKTLRYLAVDGGKYYVVGSVLLFLKTLTEYMNCAEKLPVLTTDVLNRILELLKLFNSRVCQVILGAGAMQSAGLRSITARHIALASQTIGTVIAIIPYIRNGMSRLLSSKQQILLTDFDRILRDFKEHQNELYAKLVSIMNDRLGPHASKLGAITWDNPDPKEISAEEAVTVHMAVLIKETTTLHKVLSKYLPGESLRSIFGEIFRSYVKRLDEEFHKIDLFSSAGKNRLLMDVQYFIRQLSALDGVDGPDSHLEVCVNNIKIKEKRSVHLMRTATRAGAASNSELKIPTPSQPLHSGSSPLQSPLAPPGHTSSSASSATSTASSASSSSTSQRPTSQFAYNFGKMLRNQNEGPR
ncbi:hypothetical protein BASA62_004714 [Batrachochytrium salamandrivorans]|nr:hypothetical protein BASA62_004714 [Batrachochytrium salamandrivorans]